MNKEEKLKSIMDEWKGFTDGVRVLFLIWRNIEGAKEFGKQNKEVLIIK